MKSPPIEYQPQLIDRPVLTLAEAATFLRLTTDEVAAMIDARTLPGARVEDDYRIPTAGMLEWLHGGSVGAGTPAAGAALRVPTAPSSSVAFQKDKPFSYTWPMSQREQYKEAYIARPSTDGVKIIKIGFCERRSGGMMRKRAIVFLDGYPTVEFTGANNFSTSELMASVIKGANRSQVRPDEGVPAVYQHLRVEPYNAHVAGPYCSSNLAVICKKDDLSGMAEHALIRRRLRR